MISSEHWDDLLLHCYIEDGDQLIVNLEGNKEFFRAIILDKDSKEKELVNEPGYILYLRSYMLTFTYIIYMLTYISFTLTSIVRCRGSSQWDSISACKTR